MPPMLKVDDPRVMDSTGALDLPDVPKSLLVVGAATSAWNWDRCMRRSEVP
jgi:pyruvate/2-oxoglutarate dehydrogenase complex dihydrolipoamide dehydrogenase (E3) component